MRAMNNIFSSTRQTAAAFLTLLALCLAVQAQNPAFNSGSTGADGAFNPTANIDVQLPESGVFNFTTVNIPAGVTVKFKRNSKNTPVTILASGDVTIVGGINVSAVGISADDGVNPLVGVGGPGGFDGGRGGNFFTPLGAPGEGPGGGVGTESCGSPAGHRVAVNFPEAGPPYSSPSLLPLVGGSGGGGGAFLSTPGGAGGGGGGAILIASSGAIRFPGGGAIYARGGSAQVDGTNRPGGGGSGGAIRLIANVFSGTPSLLVDGGAGGHQYICGGHTGSSGYVRVEGYSLVNLNLTNVTSGSLFYGLPRPVTQSTAPQLTIASIAGVNAPGSPKGSLIATPDITLPTTQTSPVNVVIQGANIPVGTIVKVRVSPESGLASTTDSPALAGTTAASTTTASVTLPAGNSLISATATVDLTLISSLTPLYINGERVKMMEVAATFGGKSELTYITASGKRIKPTE